MPVQKLVEFLDRKTDQLTNARIHHAAVEPKGPRMFLYIETEDPRPENTLDIKLDWNEIFGDVPCAVTGIPTFVDQITVSQAAADALQARIDQLEAALIAGGLPIPHPKEAK